MNRLTKTVNGVVTYIGAGNEFDTGMLAAELSSVQIRTVLERLAAYEGTGLEPEEVISATDMAKIACALHELNAYKDIGSIEHLRELIQAEKDGRLVVLPCKTGDKVLVDARTLPYNYLHPADGCGSFAKCEIVAIVTTKKETYLKLRALYPSRAGRRDYLKYGVTAIGKTVFLTREEAEAALKGGDG